jgi:hypothetical protein
LNSLTVPKEQGIYGFLNIFLGLGIVVLAARCASREYYLRKNRLNIKEMSKCPNCNTDLIHLKSLKWKSWNVTQCAACDALLKPGRIVAGLSFLVGTGVLFTVALPMITGKVSGGHWVYGIILLIFCPAIGFWLLLNCNRYELLEKKEKT